MTCDGCDQEFVNVFDAHPVCMICVRARAKAAFTHRCTCRSKSRNKVVTNGVRTWKSCLRCLASQGEVK